MKAKTGTCADCCFWTFLDQGRGECMVTDGTVPEAEVKNDTPR